MPKLPIGEARTAALGHGVGMNCGRPRFALLGPVAAQVIPLVVGCLLMLSVQMSSKRLCRACLLAGLRKKYQTSHSCQFSAKVHVRLFSLFESACPFQGIDWVVCFVLCSKIEPSLSQCPYLQKFRIFRTFRSPLSYAPAHSKANIYGNLGFLGCLEQSRQRVCILSCHLFGSPPTKPTRLAVDSIA